MRLLMMLFALLAWWPLADASGQIYQYTDSDGVVHLTDRLSSVPEDQLLQVKSIGGRASKTEPDFNENTSEEGVQAPVEEKVPSAESEKEDGGKGDAKIPIVEDLTKKRAALESEHARLMKRKVSLEKERETLKTPEQVRAYQKKVKQLNTEIEAYKKRNRVFQKEADAFNAAVKEEEKNEAGQ